MRAIRFAIATALIAGLFAPGAWAACYVIYGADPQIIYRLQIPPVDLSRNLHETLPQVAPGGTRAFSLDNYGCDLEVIRPAANVAAARKDTAAAAPRAPRQPQLKGASAAGGVGWPETIGA